MTPLENDPMQEEVRILDERGCLTLESMCFTSQLEPDHRAVVERHVRACPVCAQQQMALVRVTDRVRSARPRVPVPAEAKALVRQLALRSLAMRRARRREEGRCVTARVRRLRDRAAPPWYRSPVLWTATIAGLATALVAGLVALFVQ